MNQSKELIKKNGISKCPNKNISYFTQFTSCEKIDVPCSKPNIEQIVSVLVDPEIISTRIVNTISGTSSEGQRLTGKKLCIEVEMKQKILYIADSCTQSMHALENTCYFSAFIILPCSIDGSDPNVLLERNLLRLEIQVEDIVTQKINKRRLEKSVFLLINAEITPTYKLCCTEIHNCTNGNLFLLYEDGTFKKQLTDFDNSKVINPKWSPSGRNIAFLLSHRDNCSLCITSQKASEVKQLTDIYTFPFVSSYSWSNNDSLIYFASYINNKKEIFSINIFTQEWRQLTYGSDSCRSYKPKCSPDGKKIAFLRSINDKTNLFVMNTDGLSTKQLTRNGYVKDFVWSEDSSRLVCIAAKEGFPADCEKHNNNQTLEDKANGDGIFIVDTVTCHSHAVIEPKHSIKMRNLKYSPDNRYLSFIGKSFSQEDIFVFDLLKCELINLTSHDCDIEVEDYDWKADSTSIYFSANDLLYFNLYHITLCDKLKTQISNTTADGMQVSYRPRIV